MILSEYLNIRNNWFFLEKWNSIIRRILSNKSLIIWSILSWAVSLWWCWSSVWDSTKWIINIDEQIHTNKISAKNFVHDIDIWSESHTFNWKIHSDALDQDWKNVTAWFNTNWNKGSVMISWANVIYSPYMWQTWNDSFTISVLNSFDSLPNSRKVITISVNWINTLDYSNPVIKWVSDWATYYTRVMPSWEKSEDKSYIATMNWVPYVPWTWLSTGNYALELKTFFKADGSLLAAKQVNFIVNENLECNYEVKDNFNSYNLNVPRPNSDFILVNSWWEVTVIIRDLQIPPEKVWMILKFNSPEMSQNVVSWKIEFDNKVWWLASIRIRLAEWSNIIPHSWNLHIKLQNWSSMSSVEKILPYTVLSK